MKKLRKYYVNFDGQFLFCCLAKDEEQACVKALKAFNNKDHCGSSEFNTMTLPNRFIVNERGYEAHNEDKIYSVTKIEELLRKEI